MKIEDTRLENDPDKFYVAVLATRPGGQLFCTKLEYTHYPPRTPKNEDFDLNISQWQEMTFYIVAVPLKDRPLVENIAKSIGMRIADGTPTMIDSTGKRHFPLQGDNVWTLEGQYSGDEMVEVQKIFEDDKGSMLDDFQTMTEIRHGTPEDLDGFLEAAVGFNAFSPIMAILFGNDRRQCVDECFMAYIQNKVFACCTISHKTGPAIVGLYIIPKARKLGIGTRLFTTALQHCINKKLTPVHVDVMSQAVVRMIEKLPSAMRDIVRVHSFEYDLTTLEEPYVLNKDWYVV